MIVLGTIEHSVNTINRDGYYTYDPCTWLYECIGSSEDVTGSSPMLAGQLRVVDRDGSVGYQNLPLNWIGT